jgi:hypothetical protein
VQKAFRVPVDHVAYNRVCIDTQEPGKSTSRSYSLSGEWQLHINFSNI